MALQCLCRSEELVRVIRTELDYEGPIARTPFLPEYGVESYLTIAITLVVRIHLGIDHGGVCELEESKKVKKKITCKDLVVHLSAVSPG
jgi:hypothetical protein